MARKITRANCVVVMILDHEGNGRPLKTVENHAHVALQGTRPFLDDYLLEQLIADQKPLVLSHEQPSLAVSLFTKNKLLGVLKVWDKENRLRCWEDERLLLLMACQESALSIANQCPCE